MWLYHSHVEEAADTYSGLTGALVVTAKDSADDSGKPTDVDMEVFLLFEVMDENSAHYIEQNTERAALRGTPAAAPSQEGSDDGTRRSAADAPAAEGEHIKKAHVDAEAFAESNLMHGINGFVYGNMPMIDMRRGQRVRWFVFALGTEVDLHTPHWHGNTVVTGGMRTDVVNLLPASMIVAVRIGNSTWRCACGWYSLSRGWALTLCTACTLLRLCQLCACRCSACTAACSSLVLDKQDQGNNSVHWFAGHGARCCGRVAGALPCQRSHRSGHASAVQCDILTGAASMRDVATAVLWIVPACNAQTGEHAYVQA